MQETYIRSRDSPFFDGLLRAGDQALLDSQGSYNGRNVFRSVSDSGGIRRIKSVSDIPKEVMDLPLKNLAISGFNSESFEQSSSERWTKASQSSPFIQLHVQSELNELYPKYLGDECSPRTSEPDEEHNALKVSARPKIEKTYTVIERKEKLSSISFPLSAALYYNGLSPEMEIIESCESISKLNAYLRARRDDVNAGVPGRFLHAVMCVDNAGNPIFLFFYDI